MQHPSNYRTVSMGTDKEGNWVIRGHFYADSARGHTRVPRMYTADPRAHVDHGKTTVSNKGIKKSYCPH